MLSLFKKKAANINNVRQLKWRWVKNFCVTMHEGLGKTGILVWHWTIQVTFQALSALLFQHCWSTSCSNENDAAVVIYCHVHLHQFVEYFVIDLIGSKATNQKQEKIVFSFLCLGLGLNPGPFSPESIAYHLSHTTSS